MSESIYLTVEIRQVTQ